jgi:autotransporter-associated beta strand protein
MKYNQPVSCSVRGLMLAIVLGLAGAITVRADYQSTVLADNPLAYYPLNLEVDTGSTASDVSGNNNPGTLVNIFSGFNNAVGPSAFITNAISFDGLTTYIDLSTGSNPSLLNFGGAITLEAWVQPANPGASLNDIVAKGYDSSVDSSELQLRLNGGHYEGGTYNNTVGGRGASGGTATTDWAYVVCTFDGANWNMYVNGVRVGQGSDTTGALNFSTPWAIGTGTADGAGRKFAGNLSQIAIYNTSLSSNQVLNHYFRGKFNLDPSTARPVITAQPQNQSTYISGSVTFSVGVLSALPTTNQWFKNGSPLAGKTNASLVLNNVQPGDDVNYSVVVGNANGTTNSAVASLSLFVPAQLRWLGTGNSGQWDTSSSPNWFDLSNSLQVVFNPGDQVLFTDVADAPTNVVVASSVSPSLITVNATTNYFFTGTGPITGTGGLVKKGSGTLTMLSGANMTGPVVIGGGTVYAGNFAFTGASSITVTNGATLDFGGADITGNKPVFVSGAGVNNVGALYNSSFDTYGNVLSITLLGNSTFGGSSRWDLANGSTIAGPYNLTINWGYGEWNAITVGANVLGINLTNGSIGFKNLQNAFQNPSTVFTLAPNTSGTFYNGGFNGSLHLLSGSHITHYTAPAGFSGSNITFENNSLFESYFNNDQTTPISSTITLNGVAHFGFGDHNMVFSNVISGSGGFVFDYYNHAMVLMATNTYSGPTVIGSGQQVALMGNGSISQSSLIFFGGNNAGSVHFDVTGRADQTLTLASGQTLGGIGQIAGKLTVGVGATLAPAGTNTTIGITTGQNATGTISATGNIALNGTTVIKLNGNGVNDAVTSTTGSIALGGTLSLQNVSGSPLAAGNSFQVFNASSITGSFASITPATPGAGLAWDTSQLGSGVISVAAAASQPVIGSVVVSGGNLIFGGSNGTAGNPYYVLTSTNAIAPLSTWTPIATNTFGPGGVFSVTNAIVPGTPKRFYVIKLP